MGLSSGRWFTWFQGYTSIHRDITPTMENLLKRPWTSNGYGDYIAVYKDEGSGVLIRILKSFGDILIWIFPAKPWSKSTFGLGYVFGVCFEVCFGVCSGYVSRYVSGYIS